MIHRQSCTFSSPPADVARVLCSEDFHLESDRLRQDVASSQFSVQQEGEQRKVFEVRNMEYYRSRLGRMDRGRQVPSHTTYSWDGTRGTLGWVYHGQEHLGRISLSGAYILTPDGAGTRVVQEVTIEVHIPLVGNQVARFIVKEMDEAFEAWRLLLGKFLARAG